jgi:hypothetical protein
MNKSKTLAGFVATAALALTATTAFAHNGIEHLKGTLSAKTGTSVTIETSAHKKITVLLDPATKYTWNEKAATVNDLKTGDAVLVNAKEGEDEKLHGVSILWGGASASASEHADHDHAEHSK